MEYKDMDLSHLEQAQESSTALMEVLWSYRDILHKLDGWEQFYIPFDYLDEICTLQSTDQFVRLSDSKDKMRKLWARIYESIKLLDQRESEIRQILESGIE